MYDNPAEMYDAAEADLKLKPDAVLVLKWDDVFAYHEALRIEAESRLDSIKKGFWHRVSNVTIPSQYSTVDDKSWLEHELPKQKDVVTARSDLGDATRCALLAGRIASLVRLRFEGFVARESNGTGRTAR